MTVRCIDCHRFNLRNSDMRMHDLGNCQRKPTSHYCSATYVRRCPDFLPTNAETVAKRSEWLERTKGKPCTATA